MYYIKPVGSVCYDKESVFYGMESHAFVMERDILVPLAVNSSIWINHFGLTNIPSVIAFEGDKETADLVQSGLNAIFPYGFVVREVNW